MASCGGIFRDSASNFIFAFAHKLPACSVLDAEIWGIYHGLCIAWNTGYRRIVVESDSQEAIDLLISGKEAPSCVNQLVRSTLEVGGGDLKTSWSKVDREFNVVGG